MPTDPQYSLACIFTSKKGCNCINSVFHRLPREKKSDGKSPTMEPRRTFLWSRPNWQISARSRKMSLEQNLWTVFVCLLGTEGNLQEWNTSEMMWNVTSVRSTLLRNKKLLEHHGTPFALKHIVLSSILISHVFLGVIWFFCHPCPMSRHVSSKLLYTAWEDKGSGQLWGFLPRGPWWCSTFNRRNTAGGASRHLDRQGKKKNITFNQVTILPFNQILTGRISLNMANMRYYELSGRNYM